MSAWVVHKLTIDVLVSALVEFKVSHDLGQDENEIGRILWRENVQSVAYLYNLANRDDERKGELAKYNRDVEAYTWRELVTLKPGAVLKLAHCYGYQSCEHPSWNDSKAKAAIDALVYKLALKLPGYESAPWGADREDYLPLICDHPTAVSLGSMARRAADGRGPVRRLRR